MSDNTNKTIEEFMSADSKKKIQNWPHFVENEVIAFFNAHGIEKMTIEDGEGGKAKLARTRGLPPFAGPERELEKAEYRRSLSMPA